MTSKIIRELQKEQMKDSTPDFGIGDTVEVGVKIVEGDKERVQVFTGTVIARQGGGLSETFTVRRIVQGEGVERIFMLHSPKLESIKVTRQGNVRRAKLYYLRNRVGKATRVRGRSVMLSKKDLAAQAAANSAQDADAKAEEKAEEQE
jgi:large subunit ribosomal protein L19